MNIPILVSHHLCPYVQRISIALAEKDVPFERKYVELADKPDWFVELSPLGKVPLFKVSMNDGGQPVILFESAAILEYLEETKGNPLHPVSPLQRARHRAWIEYGSTILNAIASFYSAQTIQDFDRAAERLSGLFARLEGELDHGPWFAGDNFSLVDAVFGPVFRYFDNFDRIGDFALLAGMQKIAAWREQLAARPSVQKAVSADYPDRLNRFLAARNGILAQRMKRAA